MSVRKKEGKKSMTGMAIHTYMLYLCEDDDKFKREMRERDEKTSNIERMRSYLEYTISHHHYHFVG